MYVNKRIQLTQQDPDTLKVQKNDVYQDKTQHANFQGNSFIKLQNNT